MAEYFAYVLSGLFFELLEFSGFVSMTHFFYHGSHIAASGESCTNFNYQLAGMNIAIHYGS